MVSNLTAVSRPRLAMRYQVSSDLECSEIIVDASELIQHYHPKRDGEVVVKFHFYRWQMEALKLRVLSRPRPAMSSQARLQFHT